MPLPRRYDTFSISLHWVVALAVVLTYAIGLGRELVPKGDARVAVLSLHMSLGLTVFAMTLIRFAWRGLRSAPLPVDGPRWVMLSSKAMHLGLYAALLILPLVGLVGYWAKGRGVDVFGLFQLPSPIAANKPLVEVMEELHEIGAHLMMTLAGLHAAAALLHHFVFRDDTLVRMLPLAITNHVATRP